jgi:glutamine amidotransferase
MIAIVDYKMGNLRSVEKGFEAAGVRDVRVTDDPEVIGAADGVVLPGVGAFRDAASNLEASGCREALLAALADQRPFLGICLGLQLLVDTGLEDGEWRGLGVIGGTCERLPVGVKVPHIGWNTVEYTRDSALFAGVPEGSAFYFVHSYHVLPDEPSCIIGTTEYGARFTSAVQKGRAFAVQFHPEKSSDVGLRVLRNFGTIVEEAAG